MKRRKRAPVQWGALMTRAWDVERRVGADVIFPFPWRSPWFNRTINAFLTDPWARPNRPSAKEIK